MTAPPDRIFAFIAHDGRLMGITDAKANPNIDWPAYARINGPTMQAAIASAEARGREQGLREAERCATEIAERHSNWVLACGAEEVAKALRAMIPAPPAAKEKPDG